MTKREAFVEFLRKKAEAAGEIRSFEHFMAAVVDYEMRAEAGDLDPEELAFETLLNKSKRGEDRAVELARTVRQLASEPRCTCEDLIDEHDRLGKCISSSCEQHEWRLVNRSLLLEKRCRELEQELEARIREGLGDKITDEALAILRGAEHKEGPCCPPGRCKEGHSDSLQCDRWRSSKGAGGDR